MVLLRLGFMDEASVIAVQQCYKAIEGRDINQAITAVNSTGVTELYCFLIDIKTLDIVASGRQGMGKKFSTFSRELQPSLIIIVDEATRKGSFVEYPWNIEPLNQTYIKRSYVQKITLSGKEYVLGAGYAMNAELSKSRS